MTELEKAARMALEALKSVTDYDKINEARRALTQALATTERKGGPSIPAGWVACRIEHEPGYPEDVAYGPQRMMDRLKKWLDKHFANTSPQVPEDTERLDWLEKHDGRFYNLDRISCIVGVGFIPAAKPDFKAKTIREAIDAARKGE